MREDVLETDWLHTIQAPNEKCSRGATTQEVIIAGTVLLHVRMGDARIRLLFGTLSYMAVPILLGMFFIDRLVKRIFQPEHMIVFYNSALVPIIATVFQAKVKQNQYI